MADSLLKMRHHFGRKQFHTAHHLLMGNHTARIEPADHSSHAELLLETFQAFHTSVRSIEDGHDLTHLLVGHAPDTFQDFLDASLKKQTSRGVECRDSLEKRLDARLKLSPDLRRVVTDVEGREERHVLATGVWMPGGFASLAVEREVLADLVKRIHLGCDEDGIAELAHEFEGINTVRGNPDRRVRLLHWLGHDRQVVDVIKLPLKRETFRGPRLKDNLQAFEHTLAAFGLVQTEAGEVRWN